MTNQTPTAPASEAGDTCACIIRGLSPICHEFHDDSISHRGMCSNDDPSNPGYACGHLKACHTPNRADPGP